MTPSSKMILGQLVCLFVLAETVFLAKATAAEPVVSPTEAARAETSELLIPALTPIELVIDANLGSKVSKSGDTFPIRLAKPIIVDGREVLAAGFVGQGEVVHAKKSAGMGAAGELVLAARFLTVGDRQLKLRSMRFGTAGKDEINSVVAVNALSVASPLPVGMLGFFVTGKNIEIPQGTVAVAKNSEAFVIGNAYPANHTQNAVSTSIPVVQQTPNQDGK